MESLDGLPNLEKIEIIFENFNKFTDESLEIIKKYLINKRN